MHTHNMYYFLLFYSNNGYANVPHFYVYTYIACLFLSSLLKETHQMISRRFAFIISFHLTGDKLSFHYNEDWISAI
jgi:hypothetical protein